MRGATAHDDSGGVVQLIGSLITLGLLALVGAACVALFVYDMNRPFDHERFVEWLRRPRRSFRDPP